MTAMRLKRYPSPSGGFALGKMGVGARMLKQGKTARDYVQSGLVAMWDGIENAGWGTHNPNATVWKDLINDMEIPLCSAASFEDDNLHLTLSDEESLTGQFMSLPYATAYAKLSTAFGGGTGKLPYTCTTIVCGRYAPASVVTNGNIVSFDENGGGNRIVGYNTGGLVRAYAGAPKESPKITLKNDGDRDVFWIALISDVGEVQEDDSHTDHYYIFNEGNLILSDTILYRSGAYDWARPYNRPFLTYDRLFRLNASPYRPSSGWFRDVLWHDVYAYNRGLTADEIAANYAIDKERFNLP